MSHRVGLAQAGIIGAVSIGAALASTDALAQQGCCQGGLADGANAWTNGNYTSDQWPANNPALPIGAAWFPVKAPANPVPYWWFHGELELGARDFTNDPTRNGALFGNTPTGGFVFLGQNSLAKYYEYSRIAPGLFGGGHVAAGSRDGLYGLDLWANNIGYGDQSYLLNFSKIGEQYLTLGWDQTPHFYSTSALTPYFGVGSNALILPPGVLSNTVTDSSRIVPFLHQTDVAIQRDTASASYRWTPTEAWDIRLDYSHMDRTGSQVAGVTGFAPSGSNVFVSPTQVAAPVNDTTQNFGVNGEYAGISPWGQRYTFKAAYTGSQYTDNISSYTVQNPYCTGTTAASCAVPSLSPFAQISTPPSNQAHGIGGTLAADLPLASRYVGTVNYAVMTQDVAFQPMTANPSAAASPFGGGAPWNSTAALPAGSLNGRINTILTNNTLTSQLTSDLKSKLTYRYYGFDNETPRIIFPSWVPYDATGAPGTTETTISSLSIGYARQNGGAALNWRPSDEWNWNAEYGYERYNYTQADVDVTNENSGKLSADWKPVNWFTARASGYYSDRTFDTYNYPAFVKSIQFPTVPGFTPTTFGGWFYSPAYRQFMFDSRHRTKGQFLFDLVAFRGVTITPNVKYQDDNYDVDPISQSGINHSRSTSWGIDVGLVPTRYLSFTISYDSEYYKQSLYNYTDAAFNSALPGNCTPGANCLIITSDKQHVNTWTAVANIAAIPDKLDFDLRYALSEGVDVQQMLTASPPGPCTNCQGAFPTNTTLFERFDATATYKFDPTFVRQIGFAGDVKVKLRYTWERNGVTNWQNDPLAPFTNMPGLNDAIWLAYDNPNYNVQMIAASLIALW
jgi:MtrB/PioB family decaheme-associated outer membrane protein